MFYSQLIERNTLLVTKEKTRFAAGICWAKMVYVFVAGSFLGWLYETLLSYFQFGQLYSRVGVVIGPFNPIYGFGFVLLVLVLYRFKKWWVLILVGALAGGSFEYLLWLLSKIILGATSWNYHSPFFIVIGGEKHILFEYLYWGGTSAFHACGWGLMGFAAMKLIYPPISYLVEKIPPVLGYVLTAALIVFFAFDMVLTGAVLLRQAIRQTCEGAVCPYSNPLTDWLDRHYSDEVLDRIFANLDKVSS